MSDTTLNLVDGIKTTATSKSHKSFVTTLAHKVSELGLNPDDYTVAFMANKVQVTVGADDPLIFSLKHAKTWVENDFTDPEEVFDAWLAAFTTVILDEGANPAEVKDAEIQRMFDSELDPEEEGMRVAADLKAIAEEKEAKRLAKEEAAAEKEAAKKAKEEQEKKDEAEKASLTKEVTKTLSGDFSKLIQKLDKTNRASNSTRILLGEVHYNNAQLIARLKSLGDKTFTGKGYINAVSSLFTDDQLVGVKLTPAEISMTSGVWEKWFKDNGGIDVQAISSFSLDPRTSEVIWHEEGIPVDVNTIALDKLFAFKNYVTPTNYSTLAGFAKFFPEKIVKKIARFFDEEADNADDLINEYLQSFDPTTLDEKAGDDDTEVTPTSLKDMNSLDAFLELKKLVKPETNPTKNISIKKSTHDSVYASAFNLFVKVRADAGLLDSLVLTDDAVIQMVFANFDPASTPDALENVVTSLVDNGVLPEDEAVVLIAKYQGAGEIPEEDEGDEEEF